MSVSTVTALSLFFLCAYTLYSSEHFAHLKLTKFESSKSNFIIYPLAKITEPDPLPWFSTYKWSAGRIAVFLWMMFSLMMTMFYTSKLRAHLIVAIYEKPLDTLEDILENGKTVYIYDIAVPQR